MGEHPSGISNAYKLALIDRILADYFEFGDVEKDAHGTMLAIATIVQYVGSVD